MQVKTWIPGSNKELDLVFDQLREEQFQDSSHRLYENYSKVAFENAGIIANTICFNENNIPEMCSTISSRTCWPEGAYRILNRTWKTSNKKQIMTKISQAMGLTTLHQIAWLKDNRDCKLYFISRQTDIWINRVVKNYKGQFDLNFEISKNKYLTCPNECDSNCWQHIIYHGNRDILNNWKNK